ncbi:MAG: hypothetical protein ABL909_11455 [Sphingopyxis sp.]
MVLSATVLTPSSVLANEQPANVSAEAAVLQQGNSGADPSAADFVPQILLETDSSDTDVSLSLRFGISEPGRRAADGAMIGTTNIAITLSVPVSSSSGGTSLFDFNQLTDGSKLTVGLSHYWGRLQHSDPLEDGSAAHIQEQAVGQCIVTQIDEWRRTHARDAADLEAMDLWVVAYQQLVHFPGGTQNGALNGLALDSREAVAQVQATMVAQCLPNAVGGNSAVNIIRTHSGEDAAERFQMRRPLSGLAFVGLKGSVARDGYDYLDIAGFSLESTSRTSYGATAYAGYLAGDGSWSGQLSVAYQRRYATADERTICRPIAGGASECLSGADGVPTRNTRLLASAELRKSIRISGVDFGIAPRIDYDLDDNEALISLPIYALRNGDGRLNGGIRIGYGTRQDALEARVFIGVPFSTIF